MSVHPKTRTALTVHANEYRTLHVYHQGHNTRPTRRLKLDLSNGANETKEETKEGAREAHITHDQGKGGTIGDEPASVAGLGRVDGGARRWGNS